MRICWGYFSPDLEMIQNRLAQRGSYAEPPPCQQGYEDFEHVNQADQESI